MVYFPVDREGDFRHVSQSWSQQAEKGTPQAKQQGLELWMCIPDMTDKQIKMTLKRYLDFLCCFLWLKWPDVGVWRKHCVCFQCILQGWYIQAETCKHWPPPLLDFNLYVTRLMWYLLLLFWDKLLMNPQTSCNWLAQKLLSALWSTVVNHYSLSTQALLYKQFSNDFVSS